MEYYNDPCATYEMPEPFDEITLSLYDRMAITGEPMNPGEYIFDVRGDNDEATLIGGYDYSCNLENVAIKLAGAVVAASGLGYSVSTGAICFMYACIVEFLESGFNDVDEGSVRMLVMQWSEDEIHDTAEEIMAFSEEC